MSLKDNLKKNFSKKRHIAAVIAIVILLTIIGLNNYLPVGPGNHNIWTYINGFWVTHKLLVILILIIFILLIDLFIGMVKNYLKEFAAKRKIRAHKIYVLDRAQNHR